MRITFYSASVENLGVEILSAILKQRGHEVSLVFDPKVFDSEAINIPRLNKLFSYKEWVIEQIVASRPDLLCFSLFTINYQAGLQIAKAVRERINVPIIFGGVHTTLVPERVIAEPCVDMVCVGEGEEALPELADYIQDKRTGHDVANIWFKVNGEVIKNDIRPLVSNLDIWPLPDKRLFYSQLPYLAEDYYLITSLGCAYKCTYCSNNALKDIYRGKGKYFRRRSVSHVIAELEWARNNFRPRRVTFADDLFAADVAWLRDFADQYKSKVKIPFTALIHPRFLNMEVADLLKKAGCFWIAMGVQSTTPEVRRQILLREENLAEVRQAAQICHKAGLRFSVDHILNIPREQIQDLEDSLSFYNDIRPQAINAYWLQYFPKCQIIQTGIDEGYLAHEDIEKIENGTYSSSMVIGIGGNDPSLKNKLLGNFQFLFMLMPLLPRNLMQTVISRKWFQSANFTPNLILNIFIKFLGSIRYKRGYVYVSIVKKTIFHAILMLKHKIHLDAR